MHYPSAMILYDHKRRAALEEEDLAPLCVTCYLCQITGHMAVNCSYFCEIRGNLKMKGE